MGLLLAHALEQFIELFGCAVSSSLYSLDVLRDVLVTELAAVDINYYSQLLLEF